MLDEKLLDEELRRGFASAALSDLDDSRIRARMREAAAVDELVDQDDVRRAQSARGLERHQLGIARPRSNEKHLCHQATLSLALRACFSYRNSSTAARRSMKRASCASARRSRGRGSVTCSTSPMRAAGPLVIITTRSESSTASSTSCVTISAVAPVFSTMRISSSCSVARVSASRAPNGSSSKRSGERRVGEEGRTPWWPDPLKKK